MQSYDSLPRVPDFWMDIIKTQLPELYPAAAPERIRGGGPSDSDSPGAASSNRFVLTNPNRKLMQRWQASGLRTVGALKDGWDTTQHGAYTFPVVQGKEICTKVQLTGKCKPGCKNAATHVNYPPDVIKMIHTHLDKCGVPKLE